jgi:hypothetical protein
MRFCIRISAALVLLFGFANISYAADLKIVLLDGKSGHPLHRKLVCIAFPVGDPVVTSQPRACRRTDSTGTADFTLPDPIPESVNVELATNNLVPCFSPAKIVLADAMKTGLVAKNTCGDATTDTTETGEVVLYGHQKNVKEVLSSTRDEF